MRKFLPTLSLFLALGGLALAGGPAAGQSSLAGQEKRVLGLTKAHWVSFRDFNGKQLIYFTHLESYRCGLEEVRYSLNSMRLDKTWKLQPCDPKKANHITTDRPYITLPPGSASWIALQLTFADGTKSDIVRISRDGVLLDGGGEQVPAGGEVRLPPQRAGGPGKADIYLPKKKGDDGAYERELRLPPLGQ
ncbi:MAG: hypothetical protein Kow0032_06230 [Methyloligellaceae bacterium]